MSPAGGATPAEVKAGIDFLAQERSRPAPKKDDAKKPDETQKDAPKDAKPSEVSGALVEAEAWQMARPAPEEEKKKVQKPDPWIQYARVLLSSSEFLFID